jgi:pimeloyl-ACP methyl ester carboxylesterase
MMGTAMLHPERMSAADARSVIDDHARCTLAYVLQVPGTDCIAPMDPLPCPITVAWASDDDILPVAKYEAAVRERLPAAQFVVLPEVGHASMVDNPDLVIQTIIQATKIKPL